MRLPAPSAVAFALAVAGCGGQASEAASHGGPKEAPYDAAIADVPFEAAADAVSEPSPTSCFLDASSTLPGVSIKFLSTKCTFTLAEAAAGISIDYALIVAADVPGVVPETQAAGNCGTPDPSGVILFEHLTGGGKEYCLCDTGLCVLPNFPPKTLPKGSYPASFAWDGRSWSGPSDTGNPKGAPFPPGSYALSVRSIGTALDLGAFEVVAGYRVVIVP